MGLLARALQDVLVQMEKLVEALAQARAAEEQELRCLQQALRRARGSEYVKLYTPEEISKYKKRDGMTAVAILTFGALCDLEGWLTSALLLFCLTAVSLVALAIILSFSPGFGGSPYERIEEVPVQDRRRLVELTLLEDASVRLSPDELLRTLEASSHEGPSKKIYEPTTSLSTYVILCPNHLGPTEGCEYCEPRSGARKKKC